MSKPNTNEWGPAVTFSCACVSRDAHACMRLRYDTDTADEECECPCHTWADEDERHDH